MIDEIQTTCRNEDCFNPVENKDTGLCASCSHAQRKAEKQALKNFNKKAAQKPINKQSDKMKKQMAEYMAKKLLFLRGKKCAVCPHLKAEDIHHMKGRDGKLLLDQRYWLAVSREAHIKITEDSAWAIREGYSLPRHAIDN